MTTAVVSTAQKQIGGSAARRPAWRSAPADANSLEEDGRDLTGLKPNRRAALGMARTFQNIRLFNLMTVEENIMVAMHTHLRSGVFSTVLRLPRQRREERAAATPRASSCTTSGSKDPG
jgi:ABC-type branched-subunit amino acid transport system ATPase component